MPLKVDNKIIEEYISTIDEGILKREIEKTKNKINMEHDVAKKVILLQRLATLKKKECK